MTLAAILCVTVFCSAPSAAADSRAFLRQDAPAASSNQATNPTQPAQNQGSATAQDSTTPSNPPATTPATGTNPSAQTAPSTATPHRRRKKKPPQDPCDPANPAPAANAPAPGSTPNNPAPADPSAAGSPASPASNVPSNCPPRKVIVRQGGTSDPSIQLGGPAGSGPSHGHDNTSQMLATADANLKKLDGQKLTADQQDVVTQIRQFMDQAKTADVSGDPERARTLAWKAQLLSEGLVKPQQ